MRRKANAGTCAPCMWCIWVSCHPGITARRAVSAFRAVVTDSEAVAGRSHAKANTCPAAGNSAQDVHCPLQVQVPASEAELCKCCSLALLCVTSFIVIYPLEVTAF